MGADGGLGAALSRLASTFGPYLRAARSMELAMNSGFVRAVDDELHR
jgi:hypothetical protein